METTQLLLTVILSLTTILLVIIGLQLIFILIDLRKILKKINQIIESFEKVGTSLEHGFDEVLGFFSGVKVLLKIFDLFEKKNGKK
jgi:uncharacterized protein YoxC